jgi:hypothetical protein
MMATTIPVFTSALPTVSGLYRITVLPEGYTIEALEKDVAREMAHSWEEYEKKVIDREMRGTATETPVGILGCHK